GTMPEEDKWVHYTLTFDGMLEKIYVDSVLNNQSQRNLFVHPGCDIMVGFSGQSGEYLRGSIASLRMYDKCFPEDSIGYLMKMDALDIDYDWVPTVIDKLDQQEKLEESVNVFYNPEHNSLIIQNPDEKQNIEKILISDLTGRLLHSENHQFIKERTEIPAPDTNSFVITIQSKSEIFSKLILKQ
ncbi:MAG: hypothetical protein JW801_01425, partial [Bacteroidales bacterium]|nr:hypothetical protein [Bacteroidales bacterium]